MSIIWRIDNKNMVHSHCRILSSCQETNKTQESCRYMELETTTLGEVTQTINGNRCILSYMCMLAISFNHVFFIQNIQSSSKEREI